MKRMSKRSSVLLLLFAVCGQLCIAQSEAPKAVSLRDLTSKPESFDGKIVRVRASALMGWEGDNFLVEPHEGAKANRTFTDRSTALVWIDCESVQSYKACSGLSGLQYGSATFIGRFHYIPSGTGRIKGVFDTGPFQLEVLRITEVKHADTPLEPLLRPDSWLAPCAPICSL